MALMKPGLSGPQGACLKDTKIRLDKLLVDRALAFSRERARAMILSGSVLVDEQRRDKAGALISAGAVIRIKGEGHPYVSRGGVKLKSALEIFGICVRNLVCLDVGASTGGFTDCLLQEGAARVYAIDVGYGQLAWRLRQDPRVTSIERTNIRTFDGRGLEDPIDLTTVDASFISLKLVIPAVLRLIKADAVLLALIKPQFEVGRAAVEKHGVVRNPDLHRQVIEEMKAFFDQMNLHVLGTSESPITGPAGNREFFIWAKRGL
jgi:23S rRNA (cytidine1920-2'-O)/16S rRNA (cytidine1409-2'-O)-methyltransferase